MAEEVATAPAPTPEPAPAPERQAPPERPAPDAAPATPEPQASAPSTEGKAEPKAEAPDLWALLDTADPQELLKHPRVGGIVGSRLEAERRRADQEATARVQAQQADEHLEHLRKTDPDAFAAEIGRRKEEAARAGQVVSGIHARVLNLVSTLPDEVKAPLSGKNYPGTYDEGVFAYTRDLMEAYAAHREKTAVAKAEQRWEKERREAIRKEILAEINGGEPSPDTTRGSAPANGFKVPTTLAELKRLPQSVYREHAKEIDAAVLSGRVK